VDKLQQGVNATQELDILQDVIRRARKQQGLADPDSTGSEETVEQVGSEDS
jgi:hypothetical protein